MTIIKNAVRWFKRRGTEKSTLVGLSAIAGIWGFHELGVELDKIVQTIAILSGMGLIVCPTRKHDDAGA